jgi:hypothetical protein
MYNTKISLLLLLVTSTRYLPRPFRSLRSPRCRKGVQASSSAWWSTDDSERQRRRPSWLSCFGGRRECTPEDASPSNDMQKQLRSSYFKVESSHKYRIINRYARSIMTVFFSGDSSCTYPFSWTVFFILFFGFFLMQENRIFLFFFS